MGQISRLRVLKDAREAAGKAQPLQTFFSSYPDFDCNPSAPSGPEFQRLRRHQKWTRRNDAGESAWKNFRSALVLEFNARFGTKVDDLLAWQTLCGIVGVEVKKGTTDWQTCEKLLKSVRFNLVDVVDARRRDQGETVQNFANPEALEEYTKKSASYFPRSHPAAGGLLKRVLKKASRNDVADGVSDAPERNETGSSEELQAEREVTKILGH